MKRIFQTLSQKWPEYLLEILVITIGILGAYALNNWNEDRKQKKQEISYLEAINLEFKENRKQFHSVMRAHQFSLTSCEKLLEEWGKEQPNPDSLSSYMYGFWQTYTFDPSQSSIESLLSTSSIEIIQNLELRQILLSWRDLVIDYQQEELLARDHFYNRVLPYLEDTYNLSVNPDVSKPETKFLNMIRVRKINIEQIIDGRDGEHVKIEETINRIIHLSEPK